MSSDGPALEAIVERVASSPNFRKAPVLRELLLYLARKRDAAVSEYAIGIDALGRPAEFDPKTDATVRVHMSRLRQRLKEYYETAGKDDPERIQIPLGEYRIALQQVVVAAPRGETAPLPSPSPRPPSRRPLFAAGILGLLCLALLLDNIRLRTRSPQLPPLHPLWETLVQPGKRVSLIVPAPVFFRWDQLPFVARDFRVNSAGELPTSPVLYWLRRKYGPPEVSELYTVATDTLAASAVLRYLEDRGVHATLVDTPSATLELLSSQDSIIFVGPGTSAQLGSLLDPTGYTFVPGSGTLVDRKAAPGEPTEYRNVPHSRLRSTNYGSLAVLPGRAPGTRLLVAGSSFNPALASLLTTGAELDNLRAFLEKSGVRGPCFEVLIRSEVSAQKVLSVTPVAARPLLP